MSDVRNHPKALSSDDLARIEAEERARREVRRRLDEEEARVALERQIEHNMRPTVFIPKLLGRSIAVFTLLVLTLVTLPFSLVVWLCIGVVWALIKYIRS